MSDGALPSSTLPGKWHLSLNPASHSDSCDDKQTAKGVEGTAVGSDGVGDAEALCVFHEEALSLLAIETV